MKKSTKTILSLLSASCMVATMGALTSCDNGSVNVNDKAWYSLYEKAYPQKEKSYEEWLNEILAQAEKGDKGDKGEKGDKGDKGETGDQGAPGQNGQNGQDGQNGKDGKGILSIELVGNQYKITYTDETSVLVDIPEKVEHIHNYSGELEVSVEPQGDQPGVGYISCECEDKQTVALHNIGSDNILSASGYYKIVLPANQEGIDISVSNSKSLPVNISLKSLDPKVIISSCPSYLDSHKSGNNINVALSPDYLLDVEGDSYSVYVQLSIEDCQSGDEGLPIEIGSSDLVNLDVDSDKWIYFLMDEYDKDVKFQFGNNIQVEYYRGVETDYGDYDDGEGNPDEKAIDDSIDPSDEPSSPVIDPESISSGMPYSLGNQYGYHIFRAKASDGKLSFSVSLYYPEGEHYLTAIEMSKGTPVTGDYLGKSKWYKYTADKSGKITLSLGSDIIKYETPGAEGEESSYSYVTEGPTVTVYSSASSAENKTGGDHYSTKFVVLDLKEGQTYYIKLDSVSGESIKEKYGEDEYGDLCKFPYSIGLIDYVSAQHDGYDISSPIDVSDLESYSANSYGVQWYKYVASNHCSFSVSVGDGSNSIIKYYDDEGNELGYDEETGEPLTSTFLAKGEEIYISVENGKLLDFDYIIWDYISTAVDAEKAHVVSINADTSTKAYTVNVADGEDNPISGVTVSILGVSATTDEQGKAVINVVPGNHKISLSGYGDYRLDKEYTTKVDEINVVLSSEIEMNFNVYNEDGEFVSATIILKDMNGNVIANVTPETENSISMDLFPGLYTIEVVGFDDSIYYFDYDANNYDWLGEPNYVYGEVTASLSYIPEYTINVIKDSAIKSISLNGLVAKLYDGSNVVASAVIDASGNASFKAIPGDYDIKIDNLPSDILVSSTFNERNNTYSVNLSYPKYMKLGVQEDIVIHKSQYASGIDYTFTSNSGGHFTLHIVSDDLNFASTSQAQVHLGDKKVIQGRYVTNNKEKYGMYSFELNAGESITFNAKVREYSYAGESYSYSLKIAEYIAPTYATELKLGQNKILIGDAHIESGLALEFKGEAGKKYKLMNGGLGDVSVQIGDGEKGSTMMSMEFVMPDSGSITIKFYSSTERSATITMSEV